MDRLIGLFVNTSGFGYLIILTIVVAGWLSFRTIPIDAVPDITNVQVQINTRLGALTPDTAESNITFPIESAMGAVPGVDSIRSITRTGVSQVTVVFEEGTDIYRARQLIAEQLRSIDLPPGMKPELGPLSTGLGEIVFYSVKAKNKDADTQQSLKQAMDLKTVQNWQIKPRLLLVKGVAEINCIGGYDKQVFVQPNVDRMAGYGINFEAVVAALRQNGYNSGGGYMEQTAEQILIQGSGLYHSFEDIEEVPVTQLQNFQTVRIKDIAKVNYAKQLRTGAATQNGNEALICTAFMLLGENSRSVSEDVNDKINEIKNSLPKWVEIDVLYNRSTLVDATIETVTRNLVFGSILVAIILLLLVGNIRAALITAVTIPLALASTLIAMNLAGISGNLMSLGALDFGIIIDGAVIVMDSCAHKVRTKATELSRILTRREIKDTVIESTAEIRRAAGFGQLIIAVVFLPLLALTGIEGKMFQPMATAFFFALVSAFILAFTVVPTMAGAFLSGKPDSDETWLVKIAHRFYQPALAFVLKRKKIILLASSLMLIASLGIFWRMGAEFIPRLYEGSIAIQFVRPVNITLTQSIVLQQHSEQIIKEFEEVENVFARIGTAEVATDPMGVNLSDTFIMLRPEDQWPKFEGSRRPPEQLRKAIVQKLEATLPGQRILLTQPIEMRFNELLEGVRGDVSIKVFGKDLKVLEGAASEIVEQLESLEGVGEVESELRGTSPLLAITPRMSALNRYGAPKQAVLDTVEAAIGGEQAGYIYEGVVKVPVLVRLPDNARRDIDALKRVPVGISNNFTVPLHEVADFQFKDIYATVKREATQRRAAIMINLDAADTQSFVRAAKAKIDQHIKLPEGYYIEWGGSFKNLQSAKERLAIIAPLVMIIMFFMVYYAFGNLLQTWLILLCIPFAAVGGVLNLLIMGLPFSISAAVGFIALSGVALLNGIVLISTLNDYKRRGDTGATLIRMGSSARLRAILMTALTDILGFLPMMIATGIGAEVQRPVATVVVGGIVTSTILTLFLLPILYSMLENRMRSPEAAEALKGGST